MRALVSADDVVGCVSVHLDDVYDAAYRLGCWDGSAVTVATDAATGLVTSLVLSPETVGDLVGGLFGRCRESAAEIRRSESGHDSATLGDDEESRAAAAALADLPDRRRLGLLLIDAYGVTYAQAAVALGLDVSETARTVALGRASLVRAVDRHETPTLAGHDTAVGDLGMLSDGSAPAGGRFAALRQHVSSCVICAGTLGVQTRGRSIIGALPTMSLGDAQRDVVLGAVRERADAALPSTAQVQALLDGDVQSPSLVPVALVVAALLVALVLGSLLGALLASG